MEHLELLRQLVAGADDPGDRAAVIVLTNLPHVYGRADVVDRWYHPAASGRLRVVWGDVADDLDARAVPLGDSERAALRVAVSFAGAGPVDLARVFRVLDDQVAAAIIAGMYALTGRPEYVAAAHERFAGQDDR